MQKSMKYHLRAWFFILAGCVALCFSPSARADEYTVENLTVTATAENAMQARAEAMNKAERQAFESILSRTAPEALAGVQYIPPEAISSAVSGFLVNSEDIGPKSYKGSLNITFDPTQLNALIGRATTAATQPPPPAPVAEGAAASATSAPAVVAAPSPLPPAASVPVVGGGGKITLLIPVSNLPDWLAIRSTLVKSPAVRGLSITAMSFTQVDAVVTYLGNGQQLERGLIAKGFRVYKQPTYWIVSR